MNVGETLIYDISGKEKQAYRIEENDSKKAELKSALTSRIL